MNSGHNSLKNSLGKNFGSWPTLMMPGDLRGTLAQILCDLPKKTKMWQKMPFIKCHSPVLNLRVCSATSPGSWLSASDNTYLQAFYLFRLHPSPHLGACYIERALGCADNSEGNLNLCNSKPPRNLCHGDDNAGDVFTFENGLIITKHSLIWESMLWNFKINIPELTHYGQRGCFVLVFLVWCFETASC